MIFFASHFFCHNATLFFWRERKKLKTLGPRIWTGTHAWFAQIRGRVWVRSQIIIMSSFWPYHYYFPRFTQLHAIKEQKLCVSVFSPFYLFQRMHALTFSPYLLRAQFQNLTHFMLGEKKSIKILPRCFSTPSPCVVVPTRLRQSYRECIYLQRYVQL